MVRSIFIRLRCLWEPQKTCYSHTNRWQPELWHVQQHLNGSTHRTAVIQTACMVGVSFGQKLYFVCWKPDEELIKKDLQIGITSSISAFVYLIPTLFRLSSLFFLLSFLCLCDVVGGSRQEKQGLGGSVQVNGPLDQPRSSELQSCPVVRHLSAPCLPQPNNHTQTC